MYSGKYDFSQITSFIFGKRYNLLSVGWNVGATYKILPDKSVSPNLMIFYGYNGVSKIVGNPYSGYNMTSFGITLGGNLDIKVGRKGNKFSVGLFVPFWSQEFKDNYNEMKNASYIKLENELFPAAISFGFNFLMN